MSNDKSIILNSEAKLLSSNNLIDTTESHFRKNSKEKSIFFYFKKKI